MLQRLVSDSAVDVRWEVARVLSFAPPEFNAPADELFDALDRDSDVSVRIAATFSRQGRASPAMLEFDAQLVQCREDLSRIREVIARVNDIVRPPSQLDLRPALYAAWRADYYEGIVRAIGMTFEHLGSKLFEALLDLLLLDPEEGVRWALAQMAATLAVDNSVRESLVGSLLADRHVWVRQAMLEEMTDELVAACPGIGHALPALALDPDPEVRLALARVAERLMPSPGRLSSEIASSLSEDTLAEVSALARGLL